MHSLISAHLIGHLQADPRAFELRDGGAGCELRLVIARPDFDSHGGRITRNRYVKAVSYDTRIAQHMYGCKVGDFVEILADDVRSEKPWFSQRQNTWLSGGVTFAVTKIRKVTALTPEQGQEPADNAAGVLAGVTTADHAARTEAAQDQPEPAPAETAPARPASRSRRAKSAAAA
jgi:hypothetical protein